MHNIKGFKKYNRRKKYIMNTENFNSQYQYLNAQSDWNILCSTCNSIIQNANMSYSDIDKIVKEVKINNG